MIINIIEYLEISLKKYADRTAVIDGNKTINLLNVANESKRIATTIINQNGCINKPVAVFLAKKQQQAY